MESPEPVQEGQLDIVESQDRTDDDNREGEAEALLESLPETQSATETESERAWCRSSVLNAALVVLVCLVVLVTFVT